MSEMVNNTTEIQETPEQLLIQALESAEANEPMPDEANDAPEENAEVENGLIETNPPEQIAENDSKQEAPVQSYATKEDVIAAINAAMGKSEPEADKPEEDDNAHDEDVALEFDSEEFMDEFYDNPAKAVEKAANVIAEKKVKELVSGIEKRLQPLLSQSEAAQLKDEVKSVISEFLNDTEDAKDYFSDMTEYIKGNNLDPRNRQSYLDAYRVSKLNRQGNEIERLRANQGKGLNDYLSDEGSLSEIINNKTVKDRIINEYLKGLQKGGKPATIGNGGMNTPSAQETNRAKTMKDAQAMFLESLR